MTKTDDQKGVLYHLSIIDFQPDPEQPRKYYNAQSLEELAVSIHTRGIPIGSIINRKLDRDASGDVA